MVMILWCLHKPHRERGFWSSCPSLEHTGNLYPFCFIHIAHCLTFLQDSLSRQTQHAVPQGDRGAILITAVVSLPASSRFQRYSDILIQSFQWEREFTSITIRHKKKLVFPIHLTRLGALFVLLDTRISPHLSHQIIFWPVCKAQTREPLVNGGSGASSCAAWRCFTSHGVSERISGARNKDEHCDSSLSPRSRRVTISWVTS